MGILLAYPWPGNVRELKYAMEHACVLCPGGEILPRHLPAEIASPWCEMPEAKPPRPFRGGLSPESIRSALAQAGNNRSRAARLLGVDRRTLYRNMAKYGLA
jgi:transcriptional regulator of acetoin/glycerol metabolism